MFRSRFVKSYMGIPEYLPDTELERLNSKVEAKVEVQPTILFKKPNSRQKAKSLE